MSGFEQRRQDLVACGCDGRHHAVGPDGDDVFGLREGYGLRAERAAAIGVHRLHDVADEAAILRPAWHEAGGLVATPHDRVSRALDFFNVVAISQGLVAGKIDHF